METTQDTSTAGKGRNRRRQLIVDKPLQSRIVFVATWPAAAALAATSLLLAVFCNRLHSEAVAADVELPSLLPVFLVTVFFLLVAALFVVVSAIKLSHRIAGPVVNLGRTLDRFVNGEHEARIRLRTGDHLTEVADRVNALLDWVEPQLAQHGSTAETSSVEAPVEVGAHAGEDD